MLIRATQVLGGKLWLGAALAHLHLRPMQRSPDLGGRHAHPPADPHRGELLVDVESTQLVNVNVPTHAGSISTSHCEFNPGAVWLWTPYVPTP